MKSPLLPAPSLAAALVDLIKMSAHRTQGVREADITMLRGGARLARTHTSSFTDRGEDYPEPGELFTVRVRMRPPQKPSAAVLMLAAAAALSDAAEIKRQRKAEKKRRDIQRTEEGKRK